jgi:hypothetical protein
MSYEIRRPPLAETFYLPSRGDLLKLRIGDIVKVTIQVGADIERMWAIITKQQDGLEWTGVLDNDPYGEDMAKVLKSGEEILFHPLDIIQVFEESDNQKNGEYLKEKYNVEI